MARWLLKLSYLGTEFCGWQVQPNGYSVQQALCEAFKKVFSKNIDITGCSRTDSGVHAREFCCHFDLDTDLSPTKILDAVNANTPQSISAFVCHRVPDDFHARYSCEGKNYEYLIYNSRYTNPFYEGRAFWFKYPLNIDDMNSAAQHFVGKYDFSAFCSAGSSVADKVRTITECKVSKNDNLITVSVSADGFLYNMVRIIVGTLIEVGNGKRDINSIDTALISGKREDVGITAPAHGLYLNKVFYKGW